MPPRALFPPGSEPARDTLTLSPGILSHSHVFVTGMTGSGPDGAMPVDPETQFRNAFDKIAAVAGRGRAGHGRPRRDDQLSHRPARHFDLFNTVRRDYVRDPFPAWTAIEAGGLRREGALVEIRVIAALNES